jgi:hypothetical protein
MNMLRLHWFDLGIVLAVLVGGYVLLAQPQGLALLLWISLITLFLHQFEEYRYPGYFPGMINMAMYASPRPDRYPLNTNTALLINVVLGWVGYFLAAVLSERAVWLGVALVLVSVGNVIAHTLLFNIRRHSLYNPGMLTALVLFLPLAIYFFAWVIGHNVASPLDWVVGVALGAAVNYVGVLKMIDWMKDANTPYVFPTRFLVPGKTG